MQQLNSEMPSSSTHPTSKISFLYHFVFMLLFLFIAPIFADVTIQPLPNRNRLFFNDLGFIGNHVNDWNLVTGFNASYIREQITFSEQILKTIDNTIRSSHIRI